MKMKEAMREAKLTGKPVRTTESEAIGETKVTINMRVDLEVLKKLKAEAEYKGIPYQTLIHSILTLHTRVLPLEERVEKLEKKLAGKAG